MLNISHLSRTRSIASLPCKIVLGDLIPLFSKKSFYHQGFFAVKRRAVFILGAKWKALVRGWRRDCVVSGIMTQSAQSLRQMRSIPHCSKAVFYVFVFDYIHDSATMHNLYPGFFHWSDSIGVKKHTKKIRVKFVLICGWLLTTNFTNHTNKYFRWLILCKVPYPLISNLLLLTSNF